MDREKNMKNYLINFKALAWESPAAGVRQKAFIQGGQRIRLVEFSDNFVEADWCRKGHAGYVLEGRLAIDFNGKRVEFKAGDGLWIAEGEPHKASVARGETALLILFEKK